MKGRAPIPRSQRDYKAAIYHAATLSDLQEWWQGHDPTTSDGNGGGEGEGVSMHDKLEDTGASIFDSVGPSPKLAVIVGRIAVKVFARKIKTQGYIGPRERELAAVARLTAAGRSQQQIADELNMTRRQIQRRLRDLIAWASQGNRTGSTRYREKGSKRLMMRDGFRILPEEILSNDEQRNRN